MPRPAVGEEFAAELRRLREANEALDRGEPVPEGVTVHVCRGPARRPRARKHVLVSHLDKWTRLGWTARSRTVDGKVEILWFHEDAPRLPKR